MSKDENTWPRTDNPLRDIESTPRVADGSARDRAKLRGWSIDPELTSGNPHELNGCDCRAARLRDESDDCRCTCHGRTFVHYRRGA